MPPCSKQLCNCKWKTQQTCSELRSCLCLRRLHKIKKARSEPQRLKPVHPLRKKGPYSVLYVDSNLSVEGNICVKNRSLFPFEVFLKSPCEISCSGRNTIIEHFIFKCLVLVHSLCLTSALSPSLNVKFLRWDELVGGEYASTPHVCSRTVVIRCACVCVCAAFQGVIPAFFAAQSTRSNLSPCATCLHLLNRSERSIRHMNKFSVSKAPAGIVLSPCSLHFTCAPEQTHSSRWICCVQVFLLFRHS